MDSETTDAVDSIVLGDGAPYVLFSIPIFGRVLYEYAIASCIETGVQAIYMVLIGMSTWSSVTRLWTNVRQYRAPPRSRPAFIIGPCVMLVATLAMFIIATYMWSTNLAAFFYGFKQIFLSDYPFDITLDQYLDKVAQTDVNPRATVAQEPLFLIQYLIGDALVIWRAVTLHSRVSDRRWLTFVLCVIWLVIAGTGVGQITCLYADPGTLQGNDPSLKSCTYILSKTSWALSLFLNTVATILLLYTIRIWRGTVQQVITDSKTGHILKFIFLSGIVYVTIGIIKLCLGVSAEVSLAAFWADDDQYVDPEPGLSTLSTVVDAIMPHLVGMYPTLIMVVIRFEASKDSSSTQPTHSTAVARGLASHPANAGQSFGFSNTSTSHSPEEESMAEIYAGKTLVVGPRSPAATSGLPETYFTSEDRIPHASPNV
ncbi:hypothetical protein BKA62DRAFT_826271 [Auriculariales sp. MPI-PUGE-AT-0066]|nr:hypothetical protein BKA62DRAFT_826271 [Auriculariales sp. MPI-PUGE-AT-0066]